MRCPGMKYMYISVCSQGTEGWRCPYLPQPQLEPEMEPDLDVPPEKPKDPRTFNEKVWDFLWSISDKIEGAEGGNYPVYAEPKSGIFKKIHKFAVMRGKLPRDFMFCIVKTGKDTPAPNNPELNNIDRMRMFAGLVKVHAGRQHRLETLEHDVDVRLVAKDGSICALTYSGIGEV